MLSVCVYNRATNGRYLVRWAVAVGCGLRAAGCLCVFGQVLSQVRSYFPPEFLNRIDEVVLFNKLRRQDMNEIVVNQASEPMARARRSGWGVLLSMLAWTGNTGRG
jgi:hypothetical protein